jgi:hypothetical protein
MECKKEVNKNYCNCSYSCSKKGICCQCIKYHRENRELPACFFPDNEEKKYDRSFENFVKLFQEGKI